MQVPERRDGVRSPVTVQVGGQVVNRFQPPAGLFTKTYRVPAQLHRNTPVEMVLSADPVKSVGDPRQLAVLVAHLGWRPAVGP